MGVSAYTRVQELCEERERHWLRCKQIMDLPEEHNYKERNLWEEAIKELVDFMNYTGALGRYDLSARGHILAVEVLDESKKEEQDARVHTVRGLSPLPESL